MEDGLGVEN